jgi:tetratricopeptide (TPR) repeat protein
MAAAPSSSPRERTFRVVLRPVPAGGKVEVEAFLDGQPAAGPALGLLSGDLALAYRCFLAGRLPRRRAVEPVADPPEARRAAGDPADTADAELARLGAAVGEAVFPGPVGEALVHLLAEARPRGELVLLEIEAADPVLLSLPFEAARVTPGDLLPVLDPIVRMVRRRAGIARPAAAPLPGPLRLLIAVGAPDEDKTASVPLDPEHELGTIFRALDQAGAGIEPKVLEVGHPRSIQLALEEQSFHVLYLSGHGTAGVLEMENEDGEPVPVTAAELAAAVRAPGSAVPLIFLASCQSGVAATETVSVAQGLLEQGIPMVLAMQTSVTDGYATALAGAFYKHLARLPRPLASHALALARGELEAARKEQLRRAAVDGQGEDFEIPPEFATPTLFLAGDEAPLLDRAAPLQPLRQAARRFAAGPVPLLPIGELIGRRPELREILWVLRDDQRALDRWGARVGAQILGLGGVGKSTLAGRVLQRLAEDGWRLVALGGVLTLGQLASRAGLCLKDDPHPAVAGPAAELRRPDLPDDERLFRLGELLAQPRVLFLFDNFESNLTVGGEAYRDPLLSNVLLQLLQGCNGGKILLTGRHPAPGFKKWLAPFPLRSLSPAQTRKLLLRLPGLRGLDFGELQALLPRVGGHPRMLELVDALQRQGEARFPRLGVKLGELAHRVGVPLQDPERTLAAMVDDAFVLGAQDVLLDELLTLAEAAGDREILEQAVVFPGPVTVCELAFARAGGQEPAKRQVAVVRTAVERLADLSLLTPLAGDAVEAHRWTADRLLVLLEERDAAALQEAYRRAGESLIWRVQTVSHALSDVIAAGRLFLLGQAFERAVGVVASILGFMAAHGQALDQLSLAEEVRLGLPEEHPALPGFLRETADALRVLGAGSEARERYEEALRQSQRLVNSGPHRADYQRDLSVSLNKLGDLFRALGEGEQTRQYYEQSLAIRERLVSTEPQQVDYQRDLSVSYERLGDLLIPLGEGESARQYYEQSLAIRKLLVSMEPPRADYQRDLSVSFNKLGDLLITLGEGELAWQYYKNSLAIAEHLVTTEPQRADYQRDLSVSYDRQGDFLCALGKGKLARQYYEKSLAIRERLVSTEAKRADYQQDLSVSYERLGDLLGVLGEGKAARQYYEQSLAIRKRLVSTEPQRADYQHDLSVSFNKLGDFLNALGEGKSARQYYEQSLDIFGRLVFTEPQRADYQRDLSVSYERLSDLLIELGEEKSARQYYEQSLAIRERLVFTEPQRADYHRDVSVSYERLGNLLSRLGEGKSARQYYEQSLAIREQLVSREPQRADYQRDLSVSFNKLGDLLRALGEGESARQYYEQGLAIRKKLVSAEPQRADYQRDLSVSYERLGDLLRALGEGESARQYYKKRLTIAERLVSTEPQRADYQRDLSVSYERLGDLLRALGEGESARHYYKKRLAIAERLVSTEPQRVDYQRDLAAAWERMADLDPAREQECLTAAVALLKVLRQCGALLPPDEPRLAALEKRLEGAAPE